MSVRKLLKSALSLLQPINRNAEAVFFLSTGRTGTTFLAKLFDVPAIYSVHEPQPWLFQSRLDAYLAGDHTENRWRSTLHTTRAKLINRAHGQGRLYVETSAFLSFFTPLLSRMLPKAKFIYVHRHPGEVVRSGMRRRWYNAHPNDHMRLRPRADSDYAQVWSSMSPFEKNCWYWAYYNDHCLSCVEKIEPSRVLVIPFSKITDEVTGVQKILDFLQRDLYTEDEISDMIVRPQNAQTSGAFPYYEQWNDESKATLQKIAGFCMARLNYE